MNRSLYITFQYVANADGVSKKVFSQVKALEKLGIQVDLVYPVRTDNKIIYYLNSDIFFEVALDSTYRKSNFSFYKELEKLAKEKAYKFSYIRYNCNANRKFISLLKVFKQLNTKVLLEIPTYPYDEELKHSDSNNIFNRLFRRLIYYREVINRKKLQDCVYRIITSSEDDEIFNIKTIKISNAVNPSDIELCNYQYNLDSINLITVANIAFWHGIDRVIEGLGKYYNSSYSKKVIFHIVGYGDENVVNSLKNLVEKHSLNDVVVFHGAMHGTELEAIFAISNFAIGCLGCHRKNIDKVKSLKNVEYAMHGLPMMYSESNSDFDGFNYVLKAPQDDSFIDIHEIISFIYSIEYKIDSKSIRDSVQHLTWDAQMKKIVNSLDN